MALYPCDATGHRYVGPQQTIYPALVDGGMSARRKLRLCGLHFAQMLATLEDSTQDAFADHDPSVDMRCMSCHRSEPVPTSGFFATVYAHRAERRDFWGAVHQDCAAAVLDDWHIESDMA
jgi:hypothetical protein